MTYSFLQSTCKVHHRDIRYRHTECHTSQLAVQFWDDFTHSLGCSSRGWYHILVSSTAIAPFLERQASETAIKENYDSNEKLTMKFSSDCTN